MAGLDNILSSVCNGTVCEAVYDNPLYDAHSTVKVILLKNLSDAINGRHLKIGTYNSFPLSYADPGPNGTLIGKGVAFAIVDILMEKFNFTYEVVVPDTNFEFGGTKPEDSLIEMLKVEQIDMAAAFLPKLVSFYQTIMYSRDLDEGVWMMLLKRPKASAAGSGLMAPFNAVVWYTTLIAVLSYGPCISFLTRLRSRLVHDDERHLKMSPSFWFVYSAFIKQGTNLSPEANTTRILFATWWLFIIILSAFYTANLTAFLTLSKFTLDIETPQDLFKKNYRWITSEGGSVQYAVINTNEGVDPNLYTMKLNGRAEFLNYPDVSDYLSYVDKGFVLVKESVAIDNIMYKDYLKKARDGIVEADRCTYVVAPKPFMTKLRAFAYPLNSPLKLLFDYVLLDIIQSGIVKHLAREELPGTKICPLDLQSKDRQLRNSDLIMTYLIIGGGLAAATAVFIGEVVIKRYINSRYNNNNNITNTTSKSIKFKRNKNKKFRIKDDSRPPPYESLFGKTKFNINENSQTKIINGREYYVFSSNGETRLVPVRTPSAFLYR